MAQQKQKNRFRNFECIVYDESAPDNWLNLLQDEKIPAFIMHHDKDELENGEKKKPHYHVIIMFEGVKTLDQAKEVFDLIGGVYPEDETMFRRKCVINSIRSAARYLCHYDDANKYQYNANDVICLGGADYLSICQLAQDKYIAIQEMMIYCKDNCVTCFADLMEYSARCRFDWFRCLCDNCAIIMREYLKSLHWSIKDEKLEEYGKELNKL